MRVPLLPLVVGVMLAAPLAAAQLPGVRVSGVVYDSLARVPLADAWVQIVPLDSGASLARTAVSDSLGHFAFENVAEGRYRIGFFHALFDSLGVDVPPRSVTVRGGRAVRVDLAIPSGATLRAIICGARSPSDSGIVVSGATVIGVVREARGGAPASNVVVSGEWLEISLRATGMDRRRPRLVVTTGANGWFALCNAPAGGTMFLTASRGADSTDLIETEVPAEGFLRRDLYLGPAKTRVIRDSTARPDSLSVAPRVVRSGDGRLSGSVIGAAFRRPLTGAIVHLSEGPTARADERGEFRLVNAPLGTRMLEVRSVGYYPERRAVDVIDGAPPVHVSLNTFKAVLDTVRILAVDAPDRQLSGFDQRRRTGQGRYYTRADLARRGVIEVSDLFRNVPGVWLERTPEGTQIVMRSAFTAKIMEEPDFRCRPSVFLDGLHLYQASADEIDLAVPARKVRAIEVYTEFTVPPQFTRGLTGCGSIVIWTR